jgi:hypothetical protein
VTDAEDRRRARADRAGLVQAAQARRREQESRQAQVLVDRFVEDALRTGLAAEELTARPWSGRGRYRTGILGWYLRSNGSVGVSRDGGFYLLTVPPVRFGRWRAIRLDPSPPPLQVGEGARDGESIALEALLRERLDRPR